MSFAIGKTGLERGATKLVFDHAPKVVDRHAEEGPDRVVAVSINRNTIVVEYAATEDPSRLVIRSELMTEAQVETLETLRSAAGVVTVQLDPTGVDPTFYAVFGGDEEQKVEPIFGAYPENAPARLTQWRAELTLYRMEE